MYEKLLKIVPLWIVFDPNIQFAVMMMVMRALS